MEIKTIEIPTIKRCCVCKTQKNITEFYKTKHTISGFTYCCKECGRKRCNEYNLRNKKSLSEESKNCYKRNKQIILARNKKWRDNNKEKLSECKKNEYKRNKDKYSKYQKNYLKEKLKNDSYFKFKHCLRSRIRTAIKNKYKSGSAVRDLGCSGLFAYNYIASKFKDGMSWNNYGKWHIDHIKPLASFDLEDRKQFLEAVHYTNLQPLWADENRKKYDRI